MEVTALQYIILGLVQGILEWLPISSSAFTILIMSNFFGVTDINSLIYSALFLHLGTFLAALIYFRKDVFKIVKTGFNYRRSNSERKSLFKFIIISTIITGIVGVIILIILSLLDDVSLTGKFVSFFIGLLLLVTGILQLRKTKKPVGLKKEYDLKNRDSVFIGFLQGLSALPGLSRSGVTVSGLLLRKFDDTTALKISFLMGLPVVLLANIVFNLDKFTFSGGAIYGLLASFILGLITIHILMKVSKKVNFGYFVLAFAILMILSVLI